MAARLVPFALLSLLVLLLGGCTSAADLEILWRRNPPPEGTHTITQGTSVEWYTTGGTHSVTSLVGVESFDSGIIAGPFNFTYIFYKVGQTHYDCSVHPSMNGTITVEPANHEITWQFSPQGDLTIIQGGKVTWNIVGTDHSVVSDDESPEDFSSGTLSPGQSFEYTFENVGVFPYHCGLHPSMVGTITVQAPPEQPTTTTAASTTTAAATPTATPTTTPTGTQPPVVNVDWTISSVGIEIDAVPGQKVKWTNTDSAPHTVTSNDNGKKESFNSGNMDPGDTFEHTFTTAGSFGFFCEYHPEMTGTVVVGDGSGASTLGSPVISIAVLGLVSLVLAALM